MLCLYKNRKKKKRKQQPNRYSRNREESPNQTGNAQPLKHLWLAMKWKQINHCRTFLILPARHCKNLNTRLQGTKAELRENKSLRQKSTHWFRCSTLNFRQPLVQIFIPQLSQPLEFSVEISDSYANSTWLLNRAEI